VLKDVHCMWFCSVAVASSSLLPLTLPTQRPRGRTGQPCPSPVPPPYRSRSLARPCVTTSASNRQQTTSASVLQGSPLSIFVTRSLVNFNTYAASASVFIIRGGVQRLSVKTIFWSIFTSSLDIGRKRFYAGCPFGANCPHATKTFSLHFRLT